MSRKLYKELKLISFDEFKVIEGHPHFNTEYETYNALASAKEYIKHTYREGWTLPDMPK